MGRPRKNAVSFGELPSAKTKPKTKTQPKTQPQPKVEVKSPPQDKLAFLDAYPQIKSHAEGLLEKMGGDFDDVMAAVFISNWKEAKRQFSENAMAANLKNLLARAKAGLRL